MTHEETALLLRKILSDRSIPSLPSNGEETREMVQIGSDLIALREILRQFARGNLDSEISIRGILSGYLKTLQANLRHLTWQVQQVAAGDFSQRVDFMGDFASAFNSMVVQLDRSVSDLKDSESRLLNLTNELQDEIRHRQRTEKVLIQNEERWNLAVQCSRDGIWDINLATKETWYSDRFLEMLHLTPEDLPRDLRWDRFTHPDDAEQAGFLRKLYTQEIPPQPFTLEYRFLCPDGTELWLRNKGMPVEKNEDTPSRMIGVTSDITVQKEAEYRLAHRAMHDNLTGLPNRYLLQDRIKQMVAQSKRSGNAFILVTLDLDNFKGVNDTWGHAAGDTLLIEVGKRISDCLRDTDTVARLGGDEFVFIYSCPRGQELFTTEQVLGRLYALFEKPVDLGAAQYSIQSSAGAAFFPEHASDIQQLFEKSDEALYRAKEKGKNRFAVWGEPEKEAGT